MSSMCVNNNNNPILGGRDKADSGIVADDRTIIYSASNPIPATAALGIRDRGSISDST